MYEDANIAIDPALFKPWSGSVCDKLQVLSDTAQKYVEVIGEINTLGVFNGPKGSAAETNYNICYEAAQLLHDIVKGFADTFVPAMRDVVDYVNRVETNNLGEGFSCDIPDCNISALPEKDFRESSTYAYTESEMLKVSGEFTTIKNNTNSQLEDVLTELKKICTGDGTWDGDLAKEVQPSMIKAITDNQSTIISDIETTATNLENAAANAK